MAGPEKGIALEVVEAVVTVTLITVGFEPSMVGMAGEIVHSGSGVRFVAVTAQVTETTSLNPPRGDKVNA
jgi:hypothetical protein